MVWRRLLVRGDATLADLHETLQVALGWTDAHLHRFRIHGREFAVGRDGAFLFDDARRVRLTRFAFRVRERFLYEYDFTDGWQHEVRVEAIVPLAPRRTYPVCLDGKRAAPPEECGGPWAYLRLRPWLQRRALATLITFGEALLAGHRDGRSPAALAALLEATAEPEDPDEPEGGAAGDDDAGLPAARGDDPWELEADLERLLPAHGPAPWTPWPSREVRPPYLPGGYDPRRAAAAVLTRGRLPFDPERFDRRRVNARLARLARGERHGLFEPEWV
jgi:hypothetical protein